MLQDVISNPKLDLRISTENSVCAEYNRSEVNMYV